MDFDDIVRGLMESRWSEIGCDLAHSTSSQYDIRHLSPRCERRRLGMDRIHKVGDIVGCADTDMRSPEYQRKYPELQECTGHAVIVEFVETVELAGNPDVELLISRYLLERKF